MANQTFQEKYPSGNPSLEMARHAGLAEVAYRQGDISAAVAKVEQIFEWLYTYNSYDRLVIYFHPHWVAYQVLRAADDPRAHDLLMESHRQIMHWAERMGDDELRHSFLNNVAVNRQIVAAAARARPPMDD